MQRRFSAALVASVAIVAAALTGCSSDPPPDPRTLLSNAKKRLDATPTVRFSVRSANLPKKGVVMVSADGSAKRPASFTGSFRIATSGIAATIKVVSIDGTFFAQVPFTQNYTKTSADRLGVRDPADLLSPGQGISSLLTDATNVKSVGQSRQGREVINKITARLPADVVSRFLYVSDRSASVATTFSVVEGNHELRSATFTGPFYGKDDSTTYTVTLDHYGKPVEIKRPG